MQKLIAPTALAALATLCAFPAHAENWLWYPVKGGAVAFDDESRKTDITAGTIAANTVIFYDTPKSAGPMTYSFVAERLEFECRTDRFRWSQSAILDVKGSVVTERDDGIWTPLGPEMGSTALFKRILCLAQHPPGQKEAKDIDALYVAVRAATPQAVIEIAPKTEPASSPPAAKPAATAPVVAKPAPKTDAAKPTAAPATKAAAPDAKAATPAVKPAPIDLDALMKSLSEDSTAAGKPTAPVPKTAAPTTKTPEAKTPVSKTPEVKLRPLTQ